jgi:hypothetical protein
MKLNIKESKKLAIFEGLAFVAALVAIIGCAFTAYAEGSDVAITMFQLIFGSERTDPNLFVIIGFALLILSALVSLTATVLCLLEKYYKDFVIMILGIAGGASALVGGILVGCAILLTGLDKQNSELGLIQGNWSLGLANFLVPLAGLAALILSYPAALIMAHHADLKDKDEKKKAPAKNEKSKQTNV